MSLRGSVLEVLGYWRRYRTARAYGRGSRASILRWLRTSKETTNFTYDLTPSNQLYLIEFVSVITGAERDVVAGYLSELRDDEALAGHLRAKALEGTHARAVDPDARYGRRAGWYAVVRAMKPGLVIETGVEKGLGACVLAAALLRNREEGHPGVYVGTDIDPGAGFLLGPPYTQVASIHYGDSVQSLRAIEGPIDLFINDSDHSADYERLEYETVNEKLSEKAIVLGDNAHVTTVLLEFAEMTGRRFLFFAEEPKDHWYPGAGIGAAFR